MMPNFIRRLLTLKYQYDSVLEQERAQRLLYIVSGLLIILILWIVFDTIPKTMSGAIGPFNIIVSPVAILITIILYGLIQRGHAVWAATIFVGFALFFTTIPQINDTFSPEIIQTLIPIILAGVLLGRRSLLLVTSIVVLFIVRGVLFEDGTPAVDVVLSTILTIIMAGVILSTFNSTLVRIADSASKLIIHTHRLSEYQPATENTATPRDIIADAINLLRTDLGFNYIRVVLLDDDHQPLQTFYSSIGVEQVADSSSFSFTGNSAFQQALDSASPVVVTRSSTPNLSAHLLPSSAVGVIIPAQSLNHIVALFDIQAESAGAINSETNTILNLFIGQLASNLVYQRTVNVLRDDINEQQGVIEQQRKQLLNIQHQQSEGIVTNWESYLQQRGLDAIGYDIDNKRQISDLDMGQIPDALRPAFEDGEIVVQTEGKEQIITIPIRFREAILGAMSFSIPKEIPMNDRKLDFIRSVTERLALALDNKRLFEQTQTQVERESTANEIGSVLLSSTDVQTVLQTAADRFNQALGAVTTRIYLQPDVLQPNENQQLEDTV